MPTLEDAIALAATAHQGQTDKAGAPYIFHLLRVMQAQESRSAQIVGVLHDLVEDTSYTLDDLRDRGYSAEVLAALQSVTKREGEDDAAFAMRAEQDPIGRTVKRADLEDNMRATRPPEMSEADAFRLKKYHAARQTLLQMGDN
jgi:(p)ppGpp synthase/HD superfamily hydrolase